MTVFSDAWTVLVDVDNLTQRHYAVLYIYISSKGRANDDQNAGIAGTKDGGFLTDEGMGRLKPGHHLLHTCLWL